MLGAVPFKNVCVGGGGGGGTKITKNLTKKMQPEFRIRRGGGGERGGMIIQNSTPSTPALKNLFKIDSF